MSKKRILLVNEASVLNTGYSNYGLEVMRRLFSTNKYELAELAAYVDDKDQRIHSVPWKVYSNLPSNDQERSRYNKDGVDQFGAFKFEQTCLDFLPDIVFDIRDVWMNSYIVKSPFRNFYYFSFMPTVDSMPQAEPWIDQFIQANAILAYNDWSFEIIKKQAKNKVNLIKSAPPAGSVNELPMVKNKSEHKKSFGLPTDSFIIGTIMRNQKRKLYPNLIDAFKQLLNKISEQQRKRTYLYFHVGYPDLGWDIPSLIKNSGISNKIYLTYICKACNKWFPSKYQDARTTCIHCQGNSAFLPNTQVGLSRVDMHLMVSFFDAYVQYANSEAQGMPR